MAGNRPDLQEEIARFRSWAAQLPAEQPQGWEQDYPGWGDLYRAFADFLEDTGPAGWDGATLEDLLYILARDHEAEHLVGLLAEAQPAGLFRLAEEALDQGEPDARWQLAAYLGEGCGEPSRAEALLLVFVQDGEEYVSRRALLALAHLGSPHLPVLCERAWASGHEYQRIAVLHALRSVGSRELPRYLDLAQADGRQYLMQNAVKLAAEHAKEQVTCRPKTDPHVKLK